MQALGLPIQAQQQPMRAHQLPMQARQQPMPARQAAQLPIWQEVVWQEGPPAYVRSHHGWPDF